MAVLKVYNGSAWVTSVGKVYDGAVWKEKMAFHDGAAFIDLYSGDTLDLRAMTCQEEDIDGASAKCQLYGQSHSRQGEQWFIDGGPLVKQNDTILPDTSTNDYQVKWVASSGDLPTGFSTAAGVWEALSIDTFYVEWVVVGVNELLGTVTVSLRKGTGPTLVTAQWSGDVVGIEE